MTAQGARLLWKCRTGKRRQKRRSFATGYPQLSYFSLMPKRTTACCRSMPSGHGSTVGCAFPADHTRALEKIFEDREGLVRRAPGIFQCGTSFFGVSNGRSQARSSAFQLAHLNLDVLDEAQCDRIHALKKIYRLVL